MAWQPLPSHIEAIICAKLSENKQNYSATYKLFLIQIIKYTEQHPPLIVLRIYEQPLN